MVETLGLELELTVEKQFLLYNLIIKIKENSYLKISDGHCNFI